MTYNKTILARLGKEVLKNHNDIATPILSKICEPSPEQHDLSLIHAYFKTYCLLFDIEPESIKGAVYKQSLTEKKKIFISAMVTIYQDQYKFKKTISIVFDHHPPVTTKILSEVKFRYRKDPDFTEKVNHALNSIKNIAIKQKLAS